MNREILILTILPLLTAASCVINVTTEPRNISLKHSSSLVVRFFANESASCHLDDDVEDSNLLEIYTSNKDVAFLNESTIPLGYWTVVEITSSYVGLCNFKFYTNRSNTTIYMEDNRVEVLLGKKSLNIAFVIILGMLILVNNTGFGCKLEAALLWKTLKKPLPPAIGFFCQFGLMAPLSFGIAHLWNLNPLYGIGLLTIGAAPGGGGSNIFAILLDADLELSITMSTISTFAALGMTPLWLHVLGRRILSKAKAHIPVKNVFISLATITIPVVFGMLITRFAPKVSKVASKYLKIFMLFSGCVFFSVLVYTNWYLIPLVNLKIISCCLALSASGYLLGGVIAWAFRQGRDKNITISIETGFQNVTMSLFLLKISLDHPESDLASLIPITYSLFGSVLPAVAYIIYATKNKIEMYRKKSAESDYQKVEAIGGSDSTVCSEVKEEDKRASDLELEQV